MSDECVGGIYIAVERYLGTRTIVKFVSSRWSSCMETATHCG